MLRLMKVRAISSSRATSFHGMALALVILGGLLSAAEFSRAHHSNAMFDQSQLRLVSPKRRWGWPSFGWGSGGAEEVDFTSSVSSARERRL